MSKYTIKIKFISVLVFLCLVSYLVYLFIPRLKALEQQSSLNIGNNLKKPTYKPIQVIALNQENIVRLVNKEREKENLTDLVISHALTLAAKDKANHICEYQYWNHVGPDGKTPWDFIHDRGILYGIAGENLGKDFIDAKELVNGWMHSTAHKENILKSYVQTGVGVEECLFNGVNTQIVVQMFISPSEQSDTLNENVDPNSPVHCQISPNCGGGTTPLLQWECENSTCCGFSDGTWVFYKDKQKCLEDQRNR